jgi:hypothetical protein
MENTFFADIFNFSEENKTTLLDIAKLTRYINQYRSFIFDKNNTFKGVTGDGKESLFAVLKIKKKERERSILFVVVESDNAEEDLEKMKEWIDF